MSDFDPWADDAPATLPERPASRTVGGGLGAEWQSRAGRRHRNLWGSDADADRTDRTDRTEAGDGGGLLSVGRRTDSPAQSTSGADEWLELAPITNGPSASAKRPSILIVCTGNVCRSPYIERVLAHELRGTGIRVSSAGTGALVGQPIDPGSVRLLEERGVEASRFAARQLTAQMVEDADLVLTATREHRRLVVQEAPFALGRVFTLLDFADLCEGIDLTASNNAGSPTGVGNSVQRLVAVAASRRAHVPARQDDEADIVDPFRRGDDVFVSMRAQCDPALVHVSRSLRLLHGACRTQGA